MCCLGLVKLREAVEQLLLRHGPGESFVYLGAVRGAGRRGVLKDIYYCKKAAMSQ